MLATLAQTQKIHAAVTYLQFHIRDWFLFERVFVSACNMRA